MDMSRVVCVLSIYVNIYAVVSERAPVSYPRSVCVSDYIHNRPHTLPVCKQSHIPIRSTPHKYNVLLSMLADIHFISIYLILQELS